MEDLRRFLSKFSALAGRLLLIVAGKDNRPGDPGVKTGGDTMARFDRDGLAAAGTGPVQASGEAYYELGMMYASGRSVPGLSHLAFCGLGEDGDQVGVIPSGALELTLDRRF